MKPRRGKVVLAAAFLGASLLAAPWKLCFAVTDTHPAATGDVHPADFGNPHPADFGNPHPADFHNPHPALDPGAHFAFPDQTNTSANANGNVTATFPNAVNVTIVLPPNAQVFLSNGQSSAGGGVVTSPFGSNTVMAANTVSGFTPNAVNGFAQSPVTRFSTNVAGGATPHPVSGFNPHPVGGFNQHPVGGFTPNAVGGFAPHPVGGFTPNAVNGLTPSDNFGFSNFPGFVPSTPGPMLNTNFVRNPAAQVIVTGAPPAAAVATNPTVNTFLQGFPRQVNTNVNTNTANPF